MNEWRNTDKKQSTRENLMRWTRWSLRWCKDIGRFKNPVLSPKKFLEIKNNLRLSQVENHLELRWRGLLLREDSWRARRKRWLGCTRRYSRRRLEISRRRLSRVIRNRKRIRLLWNSRSKMLSKRIKRKLKREKSWIEGQRSRERKSLRSRNQNRWNQMNRSSNKLIKLMVWCFLFLRIIFFPLFHPHLNPHFLLQMTVNLLHLLAQWSLLLLLELFLKSSHL